MGKTIVARLYEPARSYHPPKPAAFTFGVDTVTILELIETPATRDIVLKHAHWAGAMAKMGAFSNYLSIFTLRDIAAFLPKGLARSIDAVDADLRTLPRSEWPIDVR